MAPVRVQTTVSREGRRLRLVDAQLVQNGDVVARASALFLRRSEQPPDDVWSSPIHDAAASRRIRRTASGRAHVLLVLRPESRARQSRNRVHRVAAGFGAEICVDAREKLLIDGEPLSPFTQAAMAGDMTSSLTHWGTGGLKFINADYTLALSRQPEGPYIGRAALTHNSHAGIATGVATMFDQTGPIAAEWPPRLPTPVSDRRCDVQLVDPTNHLIAIAGYPGKRRISARTRPLRAAGPLHLLVHLPIGVVPHLRRAGPRIRGVVEVVGIPRPDL